VTDAAPAASEPDTLRTFVAFAADPPLAEAIARLCDDLRPRLPGLRFVRSEGFHLTLRFLGRTTRPQVEGVARRLEAAAAACPPGEARIAELGLFPERGRPRILWLGVALPAPVHALQAACEAAAVAEGFAPETRPFRSHLTLGRWREHAPRPALPHVDLGTLALRELILFRSQLRSSGSLYTALARFPLRGGEERGGPERQ
jgi:RNA 2',3'-cyclic 3'-phosphodiesterase